MIIFNFFCDIRSKQEIGSLKVTKTILLNLYKFYLRTITITSASKQRKSNQNQSICVGVTMPQTNTQMEINLNNSIILLTTPLFASVIKEIWCSVKFCLLFSCYYCINISVGPPHSIDVGYESKHTHTTIFLSWIF